MDLSDFPRATAIPRVTAECDTKESMTTTRSLQGKTLFISGASRGIGLAIAVRAARDGANIVIAAKTAEANPKLVPLSELDAPKVEPSKLDNKRVTELMTAAGLL